MRVVTAGLALSAARIGILWFLISREWGHQQSLALLPLLLLLYPEGLLLPANFSWTVTNGIGFSGVLSLGSFVIAALLVAAVGLARSGSATPR